MKPIEQIELSASDHRLILHWARLGAITEIENAESELARHVSLIQFNPSCATDPVPHRIGLTPSRAERIADLEASIRRYRTTLAQLLKIERQYKDADNERAAREIVASVLANRRDERRAENAKRTIDGD